MMNGGNIMIYTHQTTTNPVESVMFIVLPLLLWLSVGIIANWGRKK